MKTIKSVLAVGLLSMSFAGFGCGGDGAEYAAKAEKIVNEMCACKDEACMDKAREDRQTFRKELGNKYKKKEDAPESLVKKMDELDKKWRECSDKAREAAKGGAAAEENK